MCNARFQANDWEIELLSSIEEALDQDIYERVMVDMTTLLSDLVGHLRDLG